MQNTDDIPTGQLVAIVVGVIAMTIIVLSTMAAVIAYVYIEFIYRIGKIYPTANTTVTMLQSNNYPPAVELEDFTNQYISDQDTRVSLNDL